MLISSTEPPALRAIGKSSTFPERYGCDILATVKGKWVGVQRKEIKDFVASAVDGRLSKEIGQMKQLERGLLVVEGVGKWTDEGELITRGFGARWTYAQHLGLLLSIQLEGIAYATTQSLVETIRAVEVFVGHCRKEKHTALRSRPGATSVWGRPSNRDFARHLVCGLPGVGGELAERIIDQLGVPFGWKVSEEELTSVPGIGKKKARALWRALES